MFNPFDGIVTKLSLGQNALIQVCGDSTGQGIKIAPNTDTSHGWAGRFGAVLSADYDVNYDYYGATYQGSVAFNGYDIDELLRTATDPEAPTLYIYNGSMGGAQATHLIGWINGANLIPYTDPDLILIACGFNDVISGANLLARIQSLVAVIRNRCPEAPIIITTQNRSTGTYSTNYFANSYSQLTNYYVGQPLNLNPAIVKSPVEENLWVMDTQQAYTIIPLSTWLSSDIVGGLHPNDLGYQAQAEWMYGFTPRLPVITTASINTLTRLNNFQQTLTATGPNVTWSVAAGNLPSGIQLNSETGVLTGIPLAFGGTYQFTLAAINSFGSDEQAYSGPIEITTLPFVPNNIATFRQKRIGYYYPVVNRVMSSGLFNGNVNRN